jgi:ABC-type sugar transport system ATPase subunit
MSASAQLEIESAPLLSAQNVSKRFGRAVVLEDVSLALGRGEVHALLGENGAGKSTLIKILAGVHAADAGALYMDGRPIRPRTPLEARTLGVAVIHQELSLIPALGVRDNLFLGQPRTRAGLVDRRKEREEAARILAELGLSGVDPEIPVERLPLPLRQLIEIGKALGQGARVLIMDEPTSALTGPAIERLFAMVRKLCARGAAVLFVSHRMEEIEALADRITVLRDGRVAGSARRGEASLRQIVAWMLGRETEEAGVAPPREKGPARLDVRDLRVAAEGGGRPLLAGISLSARAGEIVGLAGLSDAGANECLQALFGALGARVDGEIRIDGAPVRIRSPGDAAAQGIGFVPADRRGEGLLLAMSAAHNATLVELPRLSPGGFLRPARERAAALSMAAEVGLPHALLDQEIAELSGGNQQKVAIGKWLMAKPRVLLLAEPTRGVDVGAKAEIHARLRTLAAAGAAVVVASSDVRELLSLCDRILVLSRGRIAAEFEATPDLQATDILQAAMRGEEVSS